MKSHRIAAAFVAVIICICCGVADSAGKKAESSDIVFAGRVVDKSTGEGIENARIWLKNSKSKEEMFVDTADEGEFSKKISEAGLYDVCVKKEGYYSPYHPLLLHKSMSILTDSKTRKCVLNFSLVKKDAKKLAGVVYDDDGYHVPNAVIELKGVRYFSDEFGSYVFEDHNSKFANLTVSKEGFVRDEYNLPDLNPAGETFNIGLKRLAKPVAVGPKGWTGRQFAGTVITIPEGALNRIVDIRITKIPTDFIERGRDGKPVANPAARFDFQPAGLAFKRPVRIATPALIPKEYAPEEDAAETISVYNMQKDSTELIPAVYRKNTHTVEYEMNHFGTIARDEKHAAAFREKSKRVENIGERIVFPRCIPEGCVDCVDFSYYVEWTVAVAITPYLDYKAVGIKGLVADRGDGCGLCMRGKPSLTERCDAGACRFVELRIGSFGEFEIESWHFCPWFSRKDGFYFYTTEMMHENHDSRCGQGKPCGDGKKCAEDPSECCRVTCGDGNCDQYEPVPDYIECKKCGPLGKCVPDESTPCSDNDPCTVNDRCIGGKCVGIRIASPENPNCLKPGGGKPVPGESTGSKPQKPY